MGRKRKADKKEEISFDPKKFERAVTKLIKKGTKDKRFYCNGEGAFTNGHWLVRCKDIGFDFLPETVQHADKSLLCLKKKCQKEVDCEVWLDDNATIPDLNQFTDKLEKHKTKADLRKENNHVVVLRGTDPDEKQIEYVQLTAEIVTKKKTKKITVTVNAEYLELVLALGGLKMTDYLRADMFEVEGELEPVFVRINPAVEAIIMPTRS